MDDNPWEVDQIQAEIAQTIQKEKAMREKLPENIQVSVFEISCKEIKEFLSEKYQTLIKNLIDMIAKKAKSDSQTIFSNFQMMEMKLKEKPADIEKLTDIKDYIGNLSTEM
jgi:dynein heavy chain